MFDAKRAAPTTPQESERPARKKTCPVTLFFLAEKMPTDKMSKIYKTIMQTSRRGILRWVVMLAPK